MSRNKELAKNTIIITIGKISTQFLSFFLLPIYTSLLNVEEYGSIDLISTYQQLICCFLFLQVEQAIFRFLVDVRSKQEEKCKIISTTLSFLLVQSSVLFVIFVILDFMTDYKYYAFLFGYIISATVANFFLQIARGFGENLIYAIGSFIAASSTIFFNIIFLVVFHMGMKGMLWAFILGNFCCAIYTLLKLRIRRYIKLKGINLGVLKGILQYSIPLVPNALSWWIMGASDRIIVSVVLGTKATGLLSVSHKFPTAFTTLYTIFNLSWTESASLHINDKDRDLFFKEVIHIVYNIFSSICICILAILPFVFPFLINNKYFDAYYQIPIYMLASMFNIIQGLYSVIYVARKETVKIARTTLVSAIINVIFNILLINKIGLYAASISSVMAYGINALWRYYDLTKDMDIKFDKKTIIYSSTMFMGVSVGYYINLPILSIVCVVVSVVYSLSVNKVLIKKIGEKIKMIRK